MKTTQRGGVHYFTGLTEDSVSSYHVRMCPSCNAAPVPARWHRRERGDCAPINNTSNRTQTSDIVTSNIRHMPKEAGITPEAIEKRRTIVADLLVNGWSASKIATHVGMHRDTIYEDIKAVRALWAENQTHSYDEWVQRELEALDHMEAKIAHRIDTGDTQAVAVRLRIQERRAKYLALDAPTRVIVEDSMTAEIRELAAQLGVEDAPMVRELLDADQG